eukprot:c530_g1_i2.p1 GENE.c530_g1_i2~~c530_g1_i2.p1  ORF type:complete len:191 (-),score=26.28 c530_g1_i2:294-866(-)
MSPCQPCRRITRVLQDENPKWTVTERRVGKILKKKSLTIRTDANVLASKRGLWRERGLAFFTAREQFAQHQECVRFFSERGFAKDADDLAWIVTQEDDELATFETLLEAPHLLNDARVHTVIQTAAVHYERTAPVLSLKCSAAARLLEAMQRDGPMGLVSLAAAAAAGGEGPSGGLGAGHGPAEDEIADP